MALNFKLFILRDASVTECPNCNVPGALDRKKSKGWSDRISQKLTMRKSYHCRECKWDGKIFNFRLSRKYKQVLLSYLIVSGAFLLVLVLLYLYLVSIKPR